MFSVKRGIGLCLFLLHHLSCRKWHLIRSQTDDYLTVYSCENRIVVDEQTFLYKLPHGFLLIFMIMKLIMTVLCSMANASILF